MNSFLRSTSQGGSLVALAVLWGCAGGGPAPSTATIAAENVWSSLNRPRPEPLAGAPRVSVSEIVVLTTSWEGAEGISTSLGLQELVAAGLLRRRDVNYVERRRFSAAVERERRGLPPPRNAPAAGTSSGAEYLLTGAWAASGDSATLALRLVDAESGEVRSTWRASTPSNADPASVARRTVASLLSELEALGRLPAWSDPLAEAAPTAYAASGIPLSAARAFFSGLAAEERFDWEGARRGYQMAQELSAGFFEADAALARVARLRAGGTLGGNDGDG
jgi:TolB-like protein